MKYTVIAFEDIWRFEPTKEDLKKNLWEDGEEQKTFDTLEEAKKYIEKWGENVIYKSADQRGQRWEVVHREIEEIEDEEE